METRDSKQQEEDEAFAMHIQTLSIRPSIDSSHGSKEKGINKEAEPGFPHEAMFLVLAYLPVFELLAVSEVCTSFRNAVNKDVLQWLDIAVEEPLSSRLSDDLLMRIASKANGRLRTLALMNCSKITDDGLQRVVEKNPFIIKLHLPGCYGLTPEGIIRAVRTLSQNGNSFNSVHIRNIYKVNKHHLEILSSHLQMKSAKEKPRPILYYHHFRTSPSLRFKEIMIDVEICQICGEVRMVFDCTRETCKKKREKLFVACKGCNFCIPRCEECGGCIDDEELEETVCSDNLCSNCWLHLPKCNLCNKPYCRRHANLQNMTPCSIGFVCEACQETRIKGPHSESARSIHPVCK